MRTDPGDRSSTRIDGLLPLEGGKRGYTVASVPSARAAEVQHGGALHLDETLTLSAPVVSAEAAVAATVQRVAADL